MNGQIVVGWADSTEGHAALDWAVHQALLTSRNVVVVHEMLPGFLSGGDQGEHRTQLQTKSRLDAAVQLLAERFWDLDLKVAVESDDPATGLMRWSSVADILVVGCPPNRHPRQLGTLPDHLAAAAHSPVAWIRGGWQPSSKTNSVVVVGATSTPSGRAAVRFAANEAVDINATLLAVVGAKRLSADGRALRSHFEDLAVAEPRLTVEVDWVETDPAEALIDLSRAAQLLVLGAHHSADRWSIRLGPVTQVVLGRANCPVITVGRLHLSTVPTRTEAAPTSEPIVVGSPIR